MKQTALLSELVGGAYPEIRVLDSGRQRRNWIIRVARALPPESTLLTLEKKVEGEAFATIQATYSGSATPEELSEARPSIQLVRLDENHLVARTELPARDKTIGDSDLISQWGVLVSLDKELHFEDLQGLPSEYWLPLRAARDGSAHVD